MKANKKIESINYKIVTLQHEIANFKKTISQLREERNRLVKEGGGHHQKMLETYQKAEKIKASADQAHIRYSEFRMKSEEVQKHYLEIVTTIKIVEKNLDDKIKEKQERKIEKMRKELEESAKQKLEKKKKMTIDELKMLMKKDLINIE